MDYVIDQKDYIPYEAEIILSGCIQEFIVPQIYQESGKIYWVYPDLDPAPLTRYSNDQIFFIQKLTKSYLLNPDHIIFHPRHIFLRNKTYQYQYLPSHRALLYCVEDLRRYLTLEQQSMYSSKKKHPVQQVHVIYNKHTKVFEKLVLKNTPIGNNKGLVAPELQAEIRIDSMGNMEVRSGEVCLNHRPVIKNKKYALKSGDIITQNQIELVYW